MDLRQAKAIHDDLFAKAKLFLQEQANMGRFQGVVTNEAVHNWLMAQVGQYAQAQQVLDRARAGINSGNNRPVIGIPTPSPQLPSTGAPAPSIQLPSGQTVTTVQKPGGGGGTTSTTLPNGQTVTTVQRPGSGGGGSAGGGGSGNPFLDQLYQQFQQALDQANSANEDRYQAGQTGFQDLINNVTGRFSSREQSFLDAAQGFGQSARDRINRQYDKLGAQAQADLVSRGLTASTLLPSVKRGVEEDRARALTEADEASQRLILGQSSALSGDTANALAALGQAGLGFLERRNDTGPEMGQLIALAQALGLGNMGQGFSQPTPQGTGGGGGSGLGVGVIPGGSVPVQQGSPTGFIGNIPGGVPGVGADMAWQLFNNPWAGVFFGPNIGTGSNAWPQPLQNPGGEQQQQGNQNQQGVYLNPFGQPIPTPAQQQQGLGKTAGGPVKPGIMPSTPSGGLTYSAVQRPTALLQAGGAPPPPAGDPGLIDPLSGLIDPIGSGQTGDMLPPAPAPGVGGSMIVNRPPSNASAIVSRGGLSRGGNVPVSPLPGGYAGGPTGPIKPSPLPGVMQQQQAPLSFGGVQSTTPYGFTFPAPAPGNAHGINDGSGVPNPYAWMNAAARQYGGPDIGPVVTPLQAANVRRMMQMPQRFHQALLPSFRQAFAQRGGYTHAVVPGPGQSGWGIK